MTITWEDVDLWPTGLPVTTDAVEWANRQETGNPVTNNLLRMLALSVLPTRFEMTSWTILATRQDIAEVMSMRPASIEPHLRRLNELSLLREWPEGDGATTWELGTYSFQGDYIRVFRGPYQSVPANVRAAVFARDGNACVQCKAVDDLTIDHIYPQILGGNNDPSNLRVLCRSCNSSKGAKT